MADTIFRFTNDGDTESGIDTTEKIEFNTGVVPDSTGRLVRTSFRMASDLNPHPNPDIANNPIQDSLLGVTEIVVAGYFIDHNITVGPRNLFNWSVDADVNDDFQFGRFGMTLASMNGILSLVPTVGLGGTGYMLAEVDVIDTEDPRTEVGFIARFLRNGTVTTIPGKSVTEILVTVAGDGYTTSPFITIDPPISGVTASATPVISDGTVIQVIITNAGSGYTSVPNVTFSASPGTTAQGTAVIG